MTEIQKDKWGTEFPGELARARNLAKALRPLAPKMREYLSTLKERGIDIHERCVDWVEAAKRWAIMHQYDPNYRCYGGIDGDIDCRKYESDEAPPVVITISEEKISRICRGGDCRGEPYIEYTHAKFAHSAYDQVDLYKFLLKVYEFCDGWETCIGSMCFNAYNGYSYDLNGGAIREYTYNEKRRWVQTGMMTFEKDEGSYPGYKLVSDTTHLFNRPIRWAPYEQLSDEEKKRSDRYIDDGRDY